MEIKDYVEERIVKNQLPLDVIDCVNLIDKYQTVYPDVDEMKRFFYVVLNKVGAILNNVDDELNEILGWLRVHGRNNINFYEFEEEEDYLNWLQARVHLYENLTDLNDIRLINFLELSTMNFIADITTKCSYVLTNGKDTIYFTKNGYGTTNQDKLSFIKYIVEKFTEGYNFKPIK